MRQADVARLPDGMHAAGRNLFLFVRGGARSWVFRMRHNGRQVKRGLGSASAVPLAEARAHAKRLRISILRGEQETGPRRVLHRTFATVYPEAVAALARVKRWRSAKHAAQWTATLATYAAPVLGGMSVADITRADVLRVLSPIWETETETASRVRARMEAVFSYAIRAGFRTAANPAVWRGGLEFDLPPPRRVRQRGHHEAPALAELQEIAPRLLRSLSWRAVLFGALTAARVGEFIPARACEIDERRRIWSVPPERRKDGKAFPHRVPLSTQAMALLSILAPVDGYLFPGKAEHHLHPETPRLTLSKLLGRRVTMHGCRSTFRDWAAESGQDPVAAEKALMHATGNETTQAYQRSDLLERRRPLMQAWADALCKNVSFDP